MKLWQGCINAYGEELEMELVLLMHKHFNDELKYVVY